MSLTNGPVKVSDGGGSLSVDDNGGTLSVDDGAGSLTVDGTVTVTQGTAGNLNNTATQGPANTVANAWPMKNTDGTNTAAVKAASTAAAATDPALVVSVSPNSPVTVAQATAANLKVDLSGTAANATAIKVDGSAVTQPVSGTVTVANLPSATHTPVTLYATALTGITTEALATLNINKGGTTSSGTAYTVTAGKTLRIMSFVLSVMVPSTTGCASRAFLRSAGTVSASSPVSAVAACGTGNTAFAGGMCVVTLPEASCEFAAGQQVGISHIESSTIAGSSTTGAGVTICALGYEY